MNEDSKEQSLEKFSRKDPDTHGRRQLVGRLRCREGFMYVEVLVSLLILALAILGMVPLFVQAMKENSASSDLTFATAVAQDKAEELKAKDFDALSGGSDTVTFHSITFARSWTVQTDVPFSGMKTVTVTVTPNRSSTYGENRVATVRFYRVQ